MATLPPRLQRLFQTEPGMDAILLLNGPPDPNFFWATNLHHGGTFERSAALLRPNQPPLVITSQLEETTAKKSDNAVEIYEDQDHFWDIINDEINPDDTVGINHERLSIARHENLKENLDSNNLADASDALETARLIKDPDEIERIQDACKITDKIARNIPDMAHNADTEADLAADIVHAIRKDGATISFEPIVANQKASAEPHYHPTSTPLAPGALLIDMGAKKNGYCSDITRTYSIEPPSKALVRMHEVVLEAQQAALDAIRPGVEATDVHKTAARVIDETEFKGRFIHSLGHSLGVEVHDGPGLSTRSDVTLEEGMVFTVEPGVYVPGEAGVRIEEDIVVTEDGCRRLTSADRGLIVIA